MGAAGEDLERGVPRRLKGAHQGVRVRLGDHGVEIPVQDLHRRFQRREIAQERADLGAPSCDLCAHFAPAVGGQFRDAGRGAELFQLQRIVVRLVDQGRDGDDAIHVIGEFQRRLQRKLAAVGHAHGDDFLVAPRAAGKKRLNRRDLVVKIRKSVFMTLPEAGS